MATVETARIERIKQLYAELFPLLTVSDDDAVQLSEDFRWFGYSYESEIEKALRSTARNLPQDEQCWEAAVARYARAGMRAARYYKGGRRRASVMQHGSSARPAKPFKPERSCL
jgi:hypothetical protein